MKKVWENPVIESLNVVETAWETQNGTKLDGMEYECYELYEEES